MDRETRSLFVIMPFGHTETRNAADLSEYFNTNLKARIEGDTSLKFRYVVERSADAFNISQDIIRRLHSADVVIADLSGVIPNANVMYELGVRLALTHKPVILVREENKKNRKIFDIAGFHTFEYSVARYRELEEYVVGKLQAFDRGEESFSSPVLRALLSEPDLVAEMSRSRALKVCTGLNVQLGCPVPEWC